MRDAGESIPRRPGSITVLNLPTALGLSARNSGSRASLTLVHRTAPATARSNRAPRLPPPAPATARTLSRPGAFRPRPNAAPERPGDLHRVHRPGGEPRRRPGADLRGVPDDRHPTAIA